jgi:aryl-alcohol dehydrogenase-like predicted oxidoreductase
MEYRKLGRTGLNVSELCLGTMTFGWTTDESNAYRVLNSAFENGINFIDTADIYSRWHPGNPGGVAETFIGNWMRGKPRDQVMIGTKVRGRMGSGANDEGLSRAHVLSGAEASLRRLRSDYIDLFQLHWADDETPLEETFSALDLLVRSGKVRYVGVSNFPAWKIEKSLWICEQNNWARVVCVQPHYNLVWRSEFEQEMAEFVRVEGMGVIPYSPLQGGFLTGKYRLGQPAPAGARGEGNDRMTRFLTDRNMQLLDRMGAIGADHNKTMSQVAIAWLLSRPDITSPIVGANNVGQLEQVLGAVDMHLSADEFKILDELSAWE